jgi:hypothetical protein
MIQQVAFEIPLELTEKLLSGDYVRYGGVVRDAAGHIVRHLKEIPLPVQDESVLAKALAAIKKPKSIILIGIGIVVVGGIVFLVEQNKKKRNSDILEVPQCVDNYNNALCAYLQAIRNAELNLDIINSLISALDEIRENFDGGKISIEFSMEQLDTLVNLVFDYTQKLAEANSVEFTEVQKTETMTAENAVVGLRYYLDLQKQIFESAA